MEKILIVEDLSEVLQWLQETVMEAFPDAEIQLASSLAAAHICLVASRFNLALIDLGLPDGSGIDLIRLLKQHQPTTCCVVTTIFDDAGHLFPALRAGADGYLLKDEEEQAFKASLQGILVGRPPLSAAMARMMLEQFRPASEPAVQLTLREEEMLVLVSNGYSVKRAAESLGISGHTASGYLKTLYQKLQVSNRAEATLKAVNLGLVNPSDRL